MFKWFKKKPKTDWQSVARDMAYLLVQSYKARFISYPDSEVRVEWEASIKRHTK